MKTPLTLMLCLSLGLPGCAGMGMNRPGAAAAGGTALSSASVSFMEADVDGDARISPREYQARFAGDSTQPGSFAAADINRDGVLTFDEWQAMMTPPRPAAASTATRP